MQSGGRRYVRYINNVYNRSGTLWEGRFKSALVDSDRYLLVCSRYIKMNPIRARRITCWSNYHHNAMDKADSMLSPQPLYQALRKATKDCRIVGSDKFQTEIAAVLTRRVKKYPYGEDRRSERSKQLTS